MFASTSAGQKNSILALHEALAQGVNSLECELRFTLTLAQLVKRYAGLRFGEDRPGREQKAVQLARGYIEECFAQGVSLTQLAEHVSLSRFVL